ncbi:MAG: hypothetical protein CMD98_06900 [Gammaproteobacteria bacterium]|nr:hypothetical protein [Gammaproteobacteria bacterium]|tara:strand:+ start:47156 stop:47566 length:411 start_codon:yes stop_codon:yes gene_type:complete
MEEKKYYESIWQILDAVHEAYGAEAKSKILIDNDCLALRDIMKINFDNKLTIHVSKGIEWQPGDEQKANLRDITKFLVPLSRGNIEQKRADASFKAMLEQIHPMDAVYLEQAVHKKLKVKGLTERLIKNTWGDRII